MNIASKIVYGESFDIAISLQINELINQALTYLPETAEELRAYNRNEKILIEGYLDAFEKKVTVREYYEKIKRRFDNLMKLTSGYPAPDFELQDLNGNRVTLESFKGKLVYIDFWAPWCAPCLTGMNTAKELQKQYESKGVAFVYVCLDPDLTKAKSIVEKIGVGGTHLIAPEALQSQIAKIYMVTSIPRYALIDIDGKLIAAEAPPPHSNINKIFDQFIQLDEKKTAPAESNPLKPSETKEEGQK